jgi:hypothetical protein
VADSYIVKWLYCRGYLSLVGVGVGVTFGGIYSYFFPHTLCLYKLSVLTNEN